MVKSSTRSPVLLFTHGAGFCKEIWAPIIRRMQQSSLLQRVPNVDFVSVDLPFHGSNRDNSVAAHVDERGPHVTHPANNAIALASSALLQTAQTLGFGGRPVIGIGHSMGAAALWKAEISSPGTFKGLVLFEPIYEPPEPEGTDRPYNFLADVTLKREWKCLASWIEGAVVPDEKDENAVVLACHPTVEASIYCGGRLWLSEQEQAQPKCATTFHSGSASRLYHQDTFEGIAGRRPEIYTIHAPMVGKSHLMVLEDPEACAKAIVRDLEALESFAPAVRL
ncbi:unnamed protein product [Phytophthora lilii]|uniref:Unnamed protein product n=1 Tax=Phytophthora lilii TaxID=2077276 RepID=A0A9W6YJI3_9STRA|nr:unnamed protein product [Phytophthora lilii]